MPLTFMFYSLVTLHILVVIGNILAFFITPFLAPWYEALPICSFVLLISFSQELKCPLTRLENYIRVKMGKKRIGGFVGHYFVRPARSYFGKKKTKRLRFRGKFSTTFVKSKQDKPFHRHVMDLVTNFVKHPLKRNVTNG
jgi:hypothetical protein